jgi:hypothetical protein
VEVPAERGADAEISDARHLLKDIEKFLGFVRPPFMLTAIAV